MNRKIKFRAWDEEHNKMWFTGQEGEEAGECTYRGIWSFHSYFNEQGCFEAIIIRSFCNGVGYEDEVVNLPIMQYTGLKDKNGIEVYEDDIIQYSHKAVGTILRRVRMKYGMWGIEGKVKGTQIPFANILASEYKVVGNIYENPELLEGEK